MWGLTQSFPLFTFLDDLLASSRYSPYESFLFGWIGLWQFGFLFLQSVHGTISTSLLKYASILLPPNDIIKAVISLQENIVAPHLEHDFDTLCTVDGEEPVLEPESSKLSLFHWLFWLRNDNKWPLKVEL